MSEIVRQIPVETLHSRVTVFEEQATPSESTSGEEKISQKLERQIKKIERKAERKVRRRAALPAALGIAALAWSSVSFALQSDIEANRQKAAESQPEIETIGNSAELDLGDSSIFYLAGFDTKDGSVFGDRLSIAIHQIVPGENESINYGDAPLEPEEIAKKIIEYAQEKGLGSISLAGNSLGGIVSMKVAEYIILNSYLEIDAVILNATPDGSAGLRPETQSDLATMMDVLEKIKDSKYSSYARYAMTMVQESGNYIDQKAGFNLGDFINTSNNVIEQVQEHRRPGMWLVVDQALAVTNADMKEMITNIGKQRGEKRMPVIVSMRTQNPADDTVVNVEKSSNNICEYAEKADIDCTIIEVPGAIHTSYQFDTDAFKAAVAPEAEHIKDSIASEAASYAITLYNNWALPGERGQEYQQNYQQYPSQVEAQEQDDTAEQ